jgi:hypothetical protein
LRISAHTYVTDALSSGYLAALPAIQSFLDGADEVIVVDGGSRDGTLDALRALRGAERLRIHTGEVNAWGAGDAWERPQFAIQRQTGFELATGDWAIAFDADHVLPEDQIEPLREALRARSGVLYGFRLREFADGRYREIGKRKWWCVHRRRVIDEKLAIAWGMKAETGGNERPVVKRREASFRDPLTGIEKRYWSGEAYPEDGLLPVTLVKYDHFFFDAAQLAAKLARFERMRARWEGRAPRAIPAPAPPASLLAPEAFLALPGHPRAMREFFAQWAREHAERPLDVVGLRCAGETRSEAPSGWLARLRGALRRPRAGHFESSSR